MAGAQDDHYDSDDGEDDGEELQNDVHVAVEETLRRGDGERKTREQKNKTKNKHVQPVLAERSLKVARHESADYREYGPRNEHQGAVELPQKVAFRGNRRRGAGVEVHRDDALLHRA